MSAVVKKPSSQPENATPNKLLTIYDFHFEGIESYAISPHADWYRGELIRVGRDVGLLDGQDSLKLREFSAFAEFGAYVYPYSSKSDLLVGGLWITWLYYLDDQFDSDWEQGTNLASSRKVMTQALEMVKTGKTPEDTPFWRLGNTFYTTFINTIPSLILHERLIEQTYDYLFSGSIIAMEYWKKRQVPALNVFKRARLYDSAAPTCMIPVQLGSKCILPDRLYHDPRVQQLQDCYGENIAFLNDVFSYHKEVVLAGTVWNLLKIYMTTDPSLTLAEAVDKGVRLSNACVFKFEEIAEDLLSDETLAKDYDMLKHYIWALRQWMIGQYKLSLLSTRYCNPLNPPRLVDRKRGIYHKNSL